MQILDWALLALVILAAGLAVRRIIRDRRAGKCCGNCAGCAVNCTASRAARRNAAGTVCGDTTSAVHCNASSAAHCGTDGPHTL